MTGAATNRQSATPINREHATHIGVGCRQLPELLAPAGDWDCARAAVENGADAIYFGLEKFNARMRADNFTGADLPKLMEFLHRRGVRGYVTLNTLVFENELADAEKYLRTMIAAGVDAVVVQDAGICRLIRQLSPDFPIHASTQMTITSAAGVDFARELGCCLVVLARECSIKEIEKIQTTAINSQPSTLNPQLPLEVFIHGALCVAYSGQCLTSEALGGRSANRGECAQACRMPYDLISDGKPVPLGDRKYLLSPQDLAGLEVLPELIRAGVASLKIEGRLKSPEYVANITRIYRQALDEICRSRREEALNSFPKNINETPHAVSCDKKYDMEMAFSRGLHTGWFGGTNNQQLVHARFGKKRGVFLGEVTRVLRDGVAIRLERPLKPGDGVVFDAGKPEENEEGGRVYEIRKVGRGVPAAPKSRLAAESEPYQAELQFGRGDINFSRVHAGDKLWKTSDPELDRRLRQSFAGDTPKFQRPIEIEVHGAVGKPLTLIASDESRHAAKAQSNLPLAKAQKQPLTIERLREQLGRLGGTPFKLGELKNHLPDGLILPVSELNRLRREITGELERQRAQPKRWQLNDCSSRGNEAHSSIPFSQSLLTSAATDPELIALVRNLPQLEAALKCGVRTVYCEFEDPKKYRDAVRLCRETSDDRRGPDPTKLSTLDPRPSTIFVAPPRIFKPGEDWTLEQVRSCNADGYLIRNHDHLKFFAHDRRIGDYSLNIANRLAADYFKNQSGLERVTASYDLNFQQLEALLTAAPPEWFEVTIHQHMPMFHMEHCVFCAFLSNGTDFRNCGRPCDVHDVKLRDRVGAEHPVKADVGCRNTVFNALAQTGAEYVSRMLELGVRHFRVEFLNETQAQVTQTVAKYRQLLRGEITGAQLWRELKLFNQLGVTRGQIGK
jgi:U32 family peptidase